MTDERKNIRTLAEIMVDYTFSLRYDSIPTDVLSAARRQLADTLACALGACATPAAQAVKKYAFETAGRAEATILGTDRKVPSGLAALVNGTMVRYLDANDIFVLSRGGPSGHCSDATAALLALAEQNRLNGDELLTGLVASYELQGAWAESFNFWDHGFHALTTAAWVTPIVAARLMGATPKQALHATGFAVATNMVFNTWLRQSHTIPMIKGAAAGLVGERALEAAALARLGVTATEDALESAIGQLAPSGSLELVATRLGQLGHRWTTTQNLVKPYPAQLYTQAAIEAALRLYQLAIRVEGISKLILYGHRNVCAGVQGSPLAFAPASREAADHSTPYVMAMALLRGRLTAREYDDAPWKTTEVRELMAKIQLVEEPERNRSLDLEGKLGVRLIAELIGGGVEEIIVEQPKGHPTAPLTDADLLEKMTWLLEGVASADTAERLLALCLRLSTVDDIKQLIDACRVTALTTSVTSEHYST
jgi:2-methylcitrate dehydratase